VLNTYKAVGQKVNRQMNSRSSNLLMNAKPCIGQTPGRVQYYRAENEPFLPDEIKWKISMPERIAVRELALDYEEEVQQ
jgi:hypothetical protein